MKKFIVALWIFLVMPALANNPCGVTPQDNIHIKAKQVEVNGPNGSLVITPDGSVIRNGSIQRLSDNARSLAKVYQASLREELPYFYQVTHRQITEFHRELDSVLSKKFNNNSRVRGHAQQLKQQLTLQLERVLAPTGDGIIFNVDALKTVEQDGRAIIQRSLGAMVQDSISEMSSQGLQGLLGGFDDLQTSLQRVWHTQLQKSRALTGDVCNRVNKLEAQKESLMRALP